MFYRNNYDLARESQEDIPTQYPQSYGNEQFCPFCSRQHHMNYPNMNYNNMFYPNMFYPNMFYVVHHHYHHYDHDYYDHGYDNHNYDNHSDNEE
ncbi:hypothetical protein CUB90_03660 [Clostridium sp. CT7]|nr:hypothetical protein CUB90_03660 [Clostridium sp. CT7]